MHFVLLFLWFIFTKPVFAQADPYQIADCPNDDPTFVCHVAPDIMTTKIPLSKVDTSLWPYDPTGILREATQFWSGYVKPDGDYHIGTQKYAAFGKQIQDASDIDLNPAANQETQIHDESAKPFSITSRLCVTEPDGDVVGNWVTEKEITITPDIHGLNELTEGTRRLGSFTTSYVQPSQDYRLTIMKTKKIAALSCNVNADGDILNQTNIGFVEENLYGDSAIAHLSYTILSSMVSLVSSGGEKEAEYKHKGTSNAKHVGSAANPWAAHNLCEGVGCSEADLAPITYLTDSQKKTLMEDGGLINSMYRNDSYDPNYKSSRDAQYLDQPWEVEITQSKEDANIFAYGMAKTERGYTFGNCSIMSATDPMYNRLGCNQNWLASFNAQDEGGWNCNTSLGELASSQTNQAGQDWADNNIYTDSCKTNNAWKQCHSDVISRAQKSCVDPLFALTIWLHESAASNYECGELHTGGEPVEDFGIHTASVPENFSAQLDYFLTLDYACPHTINDFVSMYYIGNQCYNAEPDKAKVTGYVAELQEIYTALGGGTLPSWPKTGSCTNKNI